MGDLEALLPNFAGGQYLDKKLLLPDELFSDGSVGNLFRPLIDELGRPREALHVAQALGGNFAFVAIRVDGAAASDVADVLIEELFRETPGEEEPASEVDGRVVRLLRFQPVGTTVLSDVHIVEVGDVVVYAGSGVPEGDEAVVTVLDDMFRPKLEEILPTEVAGLSLTRLSFPAEAVSGGGDVCAFICPWELPALARVLRVPLSSIDLALAGTETDPTRLVIVAIRVEGADEDQLVDARIRSSGLPRGPNFPIEMTIGGRAVTRADYNVFAMPDRELLYAKGDTLFLIQPLPEKGEPLPPEIEAAVAALP